MTIKNKNGDVVMVISNDTSINKKKVDDEVVLFDSSINTLVSSIGSPVIVDLDIFIVDLLKDVGCGALEWHTDDKMKINLDGLKVTKY